VLPTTNKKLLRLSKEFFIASNSGETNFEPKVRNSAAA